MIWLEGLYSELFHWLYAVLGLSFLILSTWRVSSSGIRTFGQRLDYTLMLLLLFVLAYLSHLFADMCQPLF
jgi:hypothetical protein